MTETNDLLELATIVLAERGFKWETLDDDTILVRTRDAHATFDIFIVANPRKRIVWCCYVHPVRIPADRRPAVAELLNQINWNGAMGSFELDATDGFVRFRMTIDVEGGELAPRMMHTMLSTCLHNAGRFHETIMRVALGDSEPAAAFTALLESEPSPA